MSYNHRAVFDSLRKAGFFRTLNITFPVKKETTDNAEELRQMVGRKISFDLGIANLRALGSFDIFCTSPSSTGSSGIAVMKIAKSADDLTWLRLGERCFNVKLRLGGSSASVATTGNALQQQDYSKVTQAMIQERLSMFIGHIKQTRAPVLHYSEDAKRHPEFFKASAICHDIVLKRFEPPCVELQVRCGAGFHVETFVNDLAFEIGTALNVFDLHCYRYGPFTYENALPSYAVSWDACKKASERYHDELRAYNSQVRRGFSRDKLELFLSEKLIYRLTYAEKRSQARLKSSNICNNERAQ